MMISTDYCSTASKYLPSVSYKGERVTISTLHPPIEGSNVFKLITRRKRRARLSGSQIQKFSTGFFYLRGNQAIKHIMFWISKFWSAKLVKSYEWIGNCVKGLGMA